QMAAHVVVPELTRLSMSKVCRLSTTPLGVVPNAALVNVASVTVDGVVVSCRPLSAVVVGSFIVGRVNETDRLGLFCVSVGLALTNCCSGMFFSCSIYPSTIVTAQFCATLDAASRRVCTSAAR